MSAARAQRESTCHGHPASVADAEQPSGYSQRCGGIRRAASEPHIRWRTGSPMNYDIGKCDPRPKTRTKCLENRLLGCEPPSQAFDPIGCISDLFKFGWDETAWYQGIARVFDPPAQLGDFDQIYSMPDNIHASLQAPNRVIPFAGYILHS